MWLPVRSLLLAGMIVAAFILPPLPAAAVDNNLENLIRILRDASQPTSAKGEACMKLMELGAAAKPAVPALVALLGAKDQLMRDYAVTTLGRIGPAAQAAAPALRQVADGDPSGDIRQLALDALRKIRGPHVAETTAPPTAAAAGRTPVARAPSTPAAAAPSGGNAPIRHPSAGARPPLEVHRGRYFRWAMPAGWQANETINGLDITSPDGQSGASSVILMRAPGSASPRDFIVQMLQQVPGYANLRIVSAKTLPDQPSGIPGAPWKVAELELAYTYRGLATRGTWTCGISAIFGMSYNAFMLGYQAPAPRFEEARFSLWQMANSIAITNAAQVAGNDKVIPPRNHPLDNSALIESWRQKGLSEDRISKARREGTMGYERVKDAQTGTVYEMPLETYDGTVGGYRNPRRPNEILQKTVPGD